MADAYPLSWPEGFPRAKVRDAGRFKTSLAGALKNATDSLRLFGSDSGRAVTNVVLSSNVTLGQQRPADPGVAAWFLWDGEQRCIPVDRYTTVEANLQAIHHILEARRVELRHGTLALVRATFKGFTPALPPPGVRKRPWREVLGFSPDHRPGPQEIAERYRRVARDKHPDAGGSETAMSELNVARDEALKELGQ
jgi:hypothetical protein